MWTALVLQTCDYHGRGFSELPRAGSPEAVSPISSIGFGKGENCTWGLPPLPWSWELGVGRWSLRAAWISRSGVQWMMGKGAD